MLVCIEIGRTEIHREPTRHVSGSRAIRSSDIGDKIMQLACSGCLLIRAAGNPCW